MIPEQAVRRLEQSGFSANSAVQTFRVLERMLIESGEQEVSLPLFYVTPAEVQEGQFVPIINFVLARVNTHGCTQVCSDVLSPDSPVVGDSSNSPDACPSPSSQPPAPIGDSPG